MDLKKTAASVLLVVGLALIGLYYLWPADASGHWTNEQAQEYMQAVGRLHAAQESHAHGQEGAKSPEHHAQEVAAARAEKDKQQAALNAARDASRRSGRILYWGGVGLIVAGVAVFLSARETP